MPYKKQKWTDEQISFLFELKNIKSRKERYALFVQKFPESNFSYTAINTKMSEVGAVYFNNKRRHKAPLYSEREKKGYIQIKVAYPCVYWQKQKWVYLETHPWVYPFVKSSDVFIFLDGDNRNFNPDNIELLKRRDQTAFLYAGGVVKGHPELTKINLLLARHKMALLDTAEKIGLVKNYGNRRVIKEEYNKQARIKATHKYRTNENHRERVKAYQKKYWQKLKQDPERYAIYKEKQREWARNNRKKKKKS